jgi:hypothetical protein
MNSSTLAHRVATHSAFVLGADVVVIARSGVAASLRAADASPLDCRRQWLPSANELRWLM